MPTIASLIQSIRDVRGTDTIIQRLPFDEQALNVPQSLDNFLASLGLEVLNDSWNEITREQSILLLSRVLERDLTYHVQLTSADNAKKLATAFVNQFCADARLFTNGTYHTESPECMPVTDHDLDTGVVAVDNEHIGILWVGDYD